MNFQSITADAPRRTRRLPEKAEHANFCDGEQETRIRRDPDTRTFSISISCTCGLSKRTSLEVYTSFTEAAQALDPKYPDLLRPRLDVPEEEKSRPMRSPGRTAVPMQGKVIGRLTVLRRLASDKFRCSTWLCRCECGKEIERRADALRRGEIPLRCKRGRC
jgi:hypothetical protein